MQVVGDKTEAEKLNNLPEVAPLGVEQTPSCVVMAATCGCLSLLHFSVQKFQMRRCLSLDSLETLDATFQFCANRVGGWGRGVGGS